MSGIRSVDKKPDLDIGDKARTIKDKFEKGEAFLSDEECSPQNKPQDEDILVFEQGTLYRHFTVNLCLTTLYLIRFGQAISINIYGIRCECFKSASYE